LGIELQLQFARQVELLEKPVFADVGADHLFDLTGGEQDAQAKVVDAAVVGDHRQLAGSGRANGGDQIFWNSTQPKSAGHDRHAVAEQAAERLARIIADLCRHGSPRGVEGRP
jgi:hypothetical protein